MSRACGCWRKLKASIRFRRFCVRQSATRNRHLQQTVRHAYLRQDPMAGFTQDIGARVTVTVARVGGANESSMRMLEEIESVDQVPAFLRQAKRDPQAFAPEEPAARTVVVEAHCP
jgi:hypothetical protein